MSGSSAPPPYSSPPYSYGSYAYQHTNSPKRKVGNRWGLPDPPVWKTAEFMKTSGLILLSLGMALAAGAVVGIVLCVKSDLTSMTLSDRILFVCCTVTGAIVTLIVGYKLKNRDYWNDPTYLAERRNMHLMYLSKNSGKGEEYLKVHLQEIKDHNLLTPEELGPYNPYAPSAPP